MINDPELLNEIEAALTREKLRQTEAARNRLIADLARVSYDHATRAGYPCTAADVELSQDRA